MRACCVSLFTAVALIAGVNHSLLAQERASDSRTRDIATILAHPPFTGTYVCSEHPAWQLPTVGDDLGQDCLTVSVDFDTRGARGFPRLFSGDGSRNEDWHGWNQEVLSPIDGTVAAVRINPVVNVPGTTGTPPASFVVIRRADDVYLLVAHVQDVSVKVGDSVAAGQPIARVGNNGFGRMPHIHVGAWQGRDALQIRWDQRRMNPGRP